MDGFKLQLKEIEDRYRREIAAARADFTTRMEKSSRLSQGRSAYNGASVSREVDRKNGVFTRETVRPISETLPGNPGGITESELGSQENPLFRSESDARTRHYDAGVPAERDLNSDPQDGVDLVSQNSASHYSERGSHQRATLENKVALSQSVPNGGLREKGRLLALFIVCLLIFTFVGVLWTSYDRGVSSQGWGQLHSTIADLEKRGKGAYDALLKNRPRGYLPGLENSFEWISNTSFHFAKIYSAPRTISSQWGDYGNFFPAVTSFGLAFGTGLSIIGFGCLLLYISARMVSYLLYTFLILFLRTYEKVRYVLWIKSEQAQYTKDPSILFGPITESFQQPVELVRKQREGQIEPECVFDSDQFCDQEATEADLARRWYSAFAQPVVLDATTTMETEAVVTTKATMDKEEVSTVKAVMDMESFTVEHPKIRPEVVIGEFVGYENWPSGLVRFEAALVDPASKEVRLQQLGLGFFLKARGSVYLVTTLHQARLFRDCGAGSVRVVGPSSSCELPQMKIVAHGVENNDKLDFMILKAPANLSSVLGVKALETTKMNHPRGLAMVYTFDCETKKFKVAWGDVLIPKGGGLLTHTCSTVNGSSGSPVFMREGSSFKVVGVHMGGIEKSKLNFAFPLRWFTRRSPQEWSKFYSTLTKESSYNESDDSFDDDAMRKLLIQQGLNDYAEELYGEGEWITDEEGSEMFLPNQVDSEDMEHLIDDYAHEPTGYHMAQINAAAAKYKREVDFQSSPGGPGVVKTEVVLPALPPKEKEEEVSPPVSNPNQEVLTKLEKLTEMFLKSQSTIQSLQSKLGNLQKSDSAKVPVSKSEQSGSQKSEKQAPTKGTAAKSPKAPTSKKQGKPKNGQTKSSSNGDGPSEDPQRK